MEVKINIDTKEVLEVLENIQNELQSLKNMKIETEKDDCNNKSKMNIIIDAPIKHKKEFDRTIGYTVDEIGKELYKRINRALNEE